MQNMSFMLTVDQVLARTKTITRRLGWADVTPGTILQPIVRGQGLKRGEKVQKIGGPIRVVSVRREPLGALLDSRAYGRNECRAEGFPHLSPEEFIGMFIDANRKATVGTIVTRIVFEYVEWSAAEQGYVRMAA